MNIILIGFMGSGKTEVGRRLAGRMGIEFMEFMDTDVFLEEFEEMKISEIFSKKGEAYFRDLETTLLKTFRNYKDYVIATGGGMILREENVKMLKQLGPLVLLRASPEVILERLKYAKDRPLLEGDKEKNIRELLEERTPIYEKVADFKIDTSNLSIDQIVEEIKKWLKK